MIDVDEALRGLPHFERIPSVAELRQFVEGLAADSRFEYVVAGTSAGGQPIYHVRFGRGAVKALLVGFPHCQEPIGGLTAVGLMNLLRNGNRALLEAGVEWHIVPCIDPDGAILNEGWTQQPFELDRYTRNLYLQPPGDQVDLSFPIAYKDLARDQPSREAAVLKRILDRVRPDFFFTLHNARIGGAFSFTTHDLGARSYDRIHDLLRRHDMPIQKRPIWKEVCPPFAEGIVEMFSVRKFYDYLEGTGSSPAENLRDMGAASWDYLAGIKPEAVSFVVETGYVRHPDDESERVVGGSLRRFKLRIEADTRFLATLLLEEAERIGGDLNAASPFHRASFGPGNYVLPDKDRLSEGGSPVSRYPVRDTLFNPAYDKPMTAGDRFNACMVDSGFMYYPWAYQFVRLLKDSDPTPAVRRAIDRLDAAFDEALSGLARHVDFGAFRRIELDALARVQLGCGLIALDSVLATRSVK
jgi:hypothetical protein